MNTPLDRATILDKVWRGDKLTDEEEKFYLTNIVGMPEEAADNVIAINNNEDTQLLID